MAFTYPSSTQRSAPFPRPREFLPGAREKLLDLLSAPDDAGKGCYAPGAAAVVAAAQQSAQQQWSGVLGVVLDSAKVQGDWSLVQALVRAGAETSNEDVHEAIEGGRDELAAALIEHGALINALDKNGHTPLHVAATQNNADIAQLLLQKGADPNAQDDITTTPLCLAAERGSAAAVRALLAAGADVTLMNEHYMLPLEEAAARGHCEVLKAMVEFNADVNATGDNGNTALHMAREKAVVDLLVEAGADVAARDTRGESPLFYAAAGEDIDVVRALVHHGADVGSRSNDGSTPLHAARGNAVVDVLVDAGADVEARGYKGDTPLMAAVDSGKIEAVRALVGHGADINAKTAGNGRTALHIVAYSSGDVPCAVEVVDYLLRSGADELMPDNGGEIPANMVGRCRWDDSGEEEVERVRELLAKAPANRAWRRRCPLLLCIARHRRGQLMCAESPQNCPGPDVQDTGSSCTAGSSVAEEGPEGDWAGVSGWLAGLRPGQEGIFRKILGYV